MDKNDSFALQSKQMFALVFNKESNPLFPSLINLTTALKVWKTMNLIDLIAIISL